MSFRFSSQPVNFSVVYLTLRRASFQAVLVFCVTDFSLAGGGTKPAQSTSASSNRSVEINRDGFVGNEACAKCHAAIYKSYEQTPMAHASGPAMENLIPTDFTHAESGVRYRIHADGGHTWLEFDRGGKNPLHGKRELLYYIGSGRRGLTYLFADDGFVFESPINWYGDRHVWDMTPAYQNDPEMPLNLPALTSCLHCHVSGMRPPIEGSENRYAMPLLTHSGISCERCHGPGETHTKGGSIVNPDKLPPDRRDAICMQCHMEGRVSVERAGKHVYDFRPGDSLSDYIRYYVLSDSSSRLGAVSQVEALAQSKCKKVSGDKMSCTSCHDPHFSPSADERVAYFRGKCLACHGAEFAAKHHAEQPNCTSCHMPASSSKDVAHTEVTDHRIPRIASIFAALVPAEGREERRLVPFPESQEAENDLRDFALAWESLANEGIEAARAKALELLRRSTVQFPDDAETISALAYEEQLQGNISDAQKLYQGALARDPNLIDVMTNLGVIKAQAGDFPDAIKLLQGAFSRAPGRSSVGMDLARVLCTAGKREEALMSVKRVLEFNPDLDVARRYFGVVEGETSCERK
ncbi:MAG TPA: tetratricopeptide repeat protein [Terriglobales bacterium]|nr:tetratricopeptide repeat protein [Terriglobales bacterium]